MSKYGTSVKVSELRRSFLQPGQDTAGFDKAQTFNTLLKAVDRTGIILPLHKTAFPNNQFTKLTTHLLVLQETVVLVRLH